MRHFEEKYMELTFTQEVIGSYFNSVTKTLATPPYKKTTCDYGWTTTKGQQSISYSVKEHECSLSEASTRRRDMPYVTQEMTTKFSTEQVSDPDGKPTYEPCVLHDFNIGKFGELSMFFHIYENEKFEVTVPIDALNGEQLKYIKAGSSWFIKMEW